jgi:hypothetical protein
MKVTLQIELNNHNVAAQVIALAKVLDNGSVQMLQTSDASQLSITARDALIGCSIVIMSIVQLLNHYDSKAALAELLTRYINGKFISDIKADINVIESKLSKDIS